MLAEMAGAGRLDRMLLRERSSLKRIEKLLRARAHDDQDRERRWSATHSQEVCRAWEAERPVLGREVESRCRLCLKEQGTA